MPMLVLQIDSNDSQEEIFTQIDANLPQYGDVDPAGTKAAARPGIWYINTENSKLFISITGDGTINNTTWLQVIFSVEDATTAQKGIVELATHGETLDMEDGEKVVTPLALANCFPLLTSFNDLEDVVAGIITAYQSADTALADDIADLTLLVGTPNDAPSNGTLAKRTSTGTLQAEDGIDPEDLVTVAQLDAVVIGGGGTTSPDPNKLILRSAAGRAQVEAGAAAKDIVNKGQMEAALAALGFSMAMVISEEDDDFVPQSNTIHLVDTTAHDIEADLQQSNEILGEGFIIVKIAGANIINVNPDGSEKIRGVGGPAAYKIEIQHHMLVFRACNVAPDYHYLAWSA